MSYNSLLKQTITLKTKTGLDRYGRETISSGSNYRARFQRVRKNIMDSKGNIVPIDGLVFVKSDLTVNSDDIIVYDSQNYKVVGRRDSIGKDGSTHHQTLEVIKWQT